MNQDQAAALAYRVKRLEEALSLRGLHAGQSDLDEIRTRLTRLSTLVETGNTSYGGPVRANNGPVMWTVGPFREPLDGTFDIDFDLWVPDNLLRLLRVQVRLKPVPIRNTTILQSSPSGTLTSDPNDVTSSGPTDTTSSQPSSITTSQDEDHTHSAFNLLPLVTTPGGSDGHQHGADYRYPQAGGGDHDHGMAHFHNIPHQHTIDHQHPIPTHSHTSTLGISEGGTATNLRLHIDGVDRSAVLGGPWSSAALVDITQYLLNVRNEPVAGAHPIKIESSTVGAVEVWFDFYGIAKVPS